MDRRRCELIAAGSTIGAAENIHQSCVLHLRVRQDGYRRTVQAPLYLPAPGRIYVAIHRDVRAFRILVSAARLHKQAESVSF